MNDRLVSGSSIESDVENDIHLRPRNLSTYGGQEDVKRNLAIAIEAAKQRNDHLDHVLLYGPPGLGKTTLANIISSEMTAKIKTTSESIHSSSPPSQKPTRARAIRKWPKCGLNR